MNEISFIINYKDRNLLNREINNIFIFSFGRIKFIKANKKSSDKIIINRKKDIKNNIMKLLYNNKRGNTINILGEDFMKLNYKKYKVIFKNKISEYKNFLKNPNKGNIEVKIKIFENIKDIINIIIYVLLNTNY